MRTNRSELAMTMLSVGIYRLASQHLVTMYTCLATHCCNVRWIFAGRCIAGISIVQLLLLFLS